MTPRFVAVALAAVASAAAAPAAAPPAAGIYGLSVVTQLFYVNSSTGAAVMQPIGHPLTKFAAGPSLGAIDSRAAIFYAVMLSADTPVVPHLVGLHLANGSIASSVKLPFANDGETTMGHLALNTGVSPTVAIVGGVNAKGEHLFGTVSAAAGGDYKQFANVSSAYNDVGGCGTDYVPATNELLVQFNVNSGVDDFEISVYAISLATGAVRQLSEDMAQGLDVQTLGGYDAATGHVFALGFNSSNGERELVDLDPVALSLKVVAGNVSIDTVSLNGISAFDDARRSLFWVGDRGGSDQYFLIETSVQDGAEVSRSSLCAYDECPMVLAYFAGAGA